MGRHHLVRPAPRGHLVEVVRDICGVQAQVSVAALLAMWTRVRGMTIDDVERALSVERSLVKTWCMRGATHLLPSADHPTFMAGLRRAAPRATRSWFARYGLHGKDLEAMTAAVAEALREGPLTRRELADRVVAAQGERARPWVEHGWGGVVAYAAQLGVVCFGESRGREVTFARTDAWIPGWHEVDVDEAEAAVARQYLRGYGPASPRDLAAWAGMAVRDAEAILGRLQEETIEGTSDGRIAFLLRADAATIRRSSGKDLGVRLLPAFDTFLLGHHDKSHLVDAAHYKQVYRKAGWISPVLLVDGRAAGVWSHVRRGRRLDVNIEPFGRVGPRVRDRVEAEADRLGRFLEAPEVRVAFTSA